MRPQRGREVTAPAPILFVHSGLDWITGSERCLLDLVAKIDRNRFAPIVLCNTRSLADAAREYDVPVYQSVDWTVGADRFFPARQQVDVVSQIIRQHDVRLLHANDSDYLQVLLVAARRAQIPVLSHLHILLTRAERRSSFLHQVAMCVGVSEAAVAGIRADGFPEKSIRVIYNGVDPERLSQGNANALRGQLGISDDAIVVAAVGSLIERKAVDVLISALAKLRAQEPGQHIDGQRLVHLLVIGDGPKLAALEAQAVKMSIGDRVHFLGRRADVGAILRDACDVLATAAREEAFPLNPLEGAHFGLPVVATDIAPHRESLVDGETGLLVPVDDSHAFFEAFASLAAREEFRVSLGKAGRQRVQERFLLPGYIKGFEKAYHDLLSQDRESFGWWRGSTWPPEYSVWLKSAVAKRLRRTKQ